MILSRVIEHVKKQHWTAVVLDFVIVVLGVFMGLQVQNWNADQKNKIVAHEYIAHIQEELLANQKDMKLRMEYFGQVKSHALRALEALDAPPASLGQEFIIDSYLASHALSRRVSRSAYDELLSAGEINAYIDVAVRQRIDQYYRALKGAEDWFLYIPNYRTTLRGVMLYFVQAQMTVGDCAATFGVDDNGLQTATLPQKCTLDITAEQTKMVVARLLDAGLRCDLTNALADIDQKLQLFQSVIDRSQNLYDYLEETK